MFQVVDGTLIGLASVTLESREDVARNPVRICPARKVPMKRIIVLSALLAAACGLPPETSDQPVSGTTAPAATTGTSPATTVALVTTIAVAPVAALDTTRAPWQEPELSLEDVPTVLINQWNSAENREWCSALFPEDPGSLGDNATIRPADFGGGWAVAWDLADGPGRFGSGEFCVDCGRGAYGIAGTGLQVYGDEMERWPATFTFDDESKVGYGYEGDAAADSGAPLLAYLLVKDEGCNYNIWSFLGEDHLVELVGQLRRVAGLEGEPTPWLSEVPAPDTIALGAPPWDSAALEAESIPEIAHIEWAESGSRSSCPMLFYSDLGDADGAAIRRANNAGEMLVAWDLPDGPGHAGDGYPCEDCGRGVIGLGTFRNGAFSGPVAYEWSDGSIARLRTGPYNYGVEAFLRVEGFDCEYWMWSHLGQEHLEYLFSQLRRVVGSP